MTFAGPAAGKVLPAAGLGQDPRVSGCRHPNAKGDTSETYDYSETVRRQFVALAAAGTAAGMLPAGTAFAQTRGGTIVCPINQDPPQFCPAFGSTGVIDTIGGKMFRMPRSARFPSRRAKRTSCCRRTTTSRTWIVSLRPASSRSSKVPTMALGQPPR